MLNVLECGLRDRCVPAEVIRVIHIALLCVQYHPERRPSMSQVVTMLSGNINVIGLTGECKDSQSNFEDLLVTVSGRLDSPALQKLAGDSTLYPPLSLGPLEST